MISDRYFHRDGTPYAGESVKDILIAWARDLEDREKAIVKISDLSNGFCISTVWVGISMSLPVFDPLTRGDYGRAVMNALGNAPRPLIFETVVFSPERVFYRNPLRPEKRREFRKSVEELRYATEAEALIGHDKMVAMYEHLKNPMKAGQIGGNK